MSSLFMISSAFSLLRSWPSSTAHSTSNSLINPRYLPYASTTGAPAAWGRQQSHRDLQAVLPAVEHQRIRWVNLTDGLEPTYGNVWHVYDISLECVGRHALPDSMCFSNRYSLDTHTSLHLLVLTFASATV